MIGEKVEDTGSITEKGRRMANRRQLLGSLALLSTAAASLGAAQAQQPSAGRGTPSTTMGAMTLQQCVEICLRSHSACLETARYCTEKGGMHVAPAHLALLLDCAEMCQTTANSLLRRSPQHAAICTACAQICDACAQSCEAIGNDEQMRRCAKTCRDCDQSCRDMSKQAI